MMNKTFQNSLCELLLRLKIDICFYNAPSNLKLYRITLYDITKNSMESPWPNYERFKTCLKCSLWVSFWLKIYICFYNAPISLKLSRITIYYITNIFCEGSMMLKILKIFFGSRFFGLKLIFASTMHGFL